MAHPLDKVVEHIRTVAASQGASDGELLRSFVTSDDQRAFAALVKRHGPLVFAVCKRVLGVEDAEDAFQGTFVVLARSAAKLPRGCSLSTWLHGVAYRLALNARRLLARRRRHERQAKAMAATNPALNAAWREVLGLLDEEIQRLPEQYREPFILCSLEGQSYAAAARRMDLKETTVRGRLMEARKRLQKRLSKRGVELTAVLGAAALAPSTATAQLPLALVAKAVSAATSAAVPASVSVLVKGLTASLAIKKAKVGVVLFLVFSGLVGTASMWAVQEGGKEKAPVAARKQEAAVKAEPRPLTTENSKSGAQSGPAKPVVVRENAILQRMAMSVDGDFLATVGVTHDGSTFNSTIKLWNARTGELKRALDEEKDSQLEIALSRDFLAIGLNGKLTNPRGPNGKPINSSGPREVRLLDAKTLELNHKIDDALVPGVRTWSALAFSADGKRLALAGGTFKVGQAPFLKIWDIDKRKLIDCIADLGELPPNRREPYSCLSFSPDGLYLAAVWKGEILLFDAQSGEFKVRLGPELKLGGPWAAIAFSPDSKVLACQGDENTVVLWALEEGKPRKTLKGHQGSVYTFAFSRDGRWLATGGRNSKKDEYEVILWDSKNWEMKRVFRGLTEWVHVVVFSPDGRTLAVCGGAGRDEGEGISTTGEIRLIPVP